MPSSTTIWFVLVLSISVLISWTSPIGKGDKSSAPGFSSESLASSDDRPALEYDFYRETCPQAEAIVRSSMARMYSEQKDVSASLLRLFFHDCFIEGCDASVLLDDSNDDNKQLSERQAIPNRSLKGFDKIDLIKEELEKACPGVVSCADTVSVATRDGIVLAGGPFYPVLTGRRDSSQSYYDKALAEIPRPDDDVTQTLHLFALRGFNERETVSLLGGHNIGKIGCEVIMKRVSDFRGTGQPDPTIGLDFLAEMRLKCRDSNRSSTGMSYLQALSSSILSGADFGNHYYRSLLMGRGLLFADQQLMAEAKTARLVRAYASDDGSTFRMDFARALMKMSSFGVLTGSQGQIRRNCSLPVASS